MQINKVKNNLFLKFQKANLEIKLRKREMGVMKKECAVKIKNNFLK